jgi:alcohol dehydrogenase class IV
MNDAFDIDDVTRLQARWNFPTQIRFGAGTITQLADACKQLNMHRPLVITDAGLATLKFVTDILQLLRSVNLAADLFSDVKPNPTGRNVAAGVAHYQHGKHDGVIALGGGSGLDAAKAVALMVGQQRPLWDFEDVGDNWQRVNTGGMAPVIAIPTTAGTGSEVGRASVIVDEKSHSKKIIFHPKMLPSIVIADPVLTTGLPPHITAATGLDAFTHNFEAYCAPGFHPMADGIALEAMRIIKNSLPRAYDDGGDLAARSYMLVASSMGAVAFQKGLGAVHALAHPLGALFDKHHGLLNAILLPYVVQQNRKAIEHKAVHICHCLQIEGASFAAFFQWLLEFRAALKIPNTLAEIGITADDSEKIGELATQDPSAAGNPIQYTAAQYTAIFTSAVKGNLV